MERVLARYPTGARMFLFLLACATEPPAPEAPATLPPRDPHGLAKAREDHAATPHTHASGHGGEVQVAGDLHVEVRFMRSGVMAWLTDAEDRPVDLAGVTATAVVKGPAGVQTMPMATMGDHLHAAMTLPEGVAADAVLTITRGGAPVSLEFRTTSVGSLAEHDHTALHGGVVSMWRDVHVEYLARDGELNFWVSNARRGPITEAVAGSAKVGDTTVPLTFEPATGRLRGTATPAAGERVRLEAKVGDDEVVLVFGG